MLIAQRQTESTGTQLVTILNDAVERLRGEGVHLAYGTTPADEAKALAIVNAFYDLAEALEDSSPDETLRKIAEASAAVFRRHLPASNAVMQEALQLISKALA